MPLLLPTLSGDQPRCTFGSVQCAWACFISHYSNTIPPTAIQNVKELCWNLKLNWGDGKIIFEKKSGGFLLPIESEVDPKLCASSPKSPSFFGTNGFQFLFYDTQLGGKPTLQIGIPLGTIPAIRLLINLSFIVSIIWTIGTRIGLGESIRPVMEQSNITLTRSQTRKTEIATYDRTPTNLVKDRFESSQDSILLTKRIESLLCPFYRHRKPPVRVRVYQRTMWGMVSPITLQRYHTPIQMQGKNEFIFLS